MRDKIVYNAIKRHLHEKEVLYDIGCHCGRYSLPFVRTNRVYGFDPVPGREREGFTVFRVALGGETKPVTLYFHKKGYYNSLREQALKEKLGEKSEHIASASVMMYRLDEFIKEQGLLPPDVIKIDVQGGEYDVLCGAAQTIAACRPILVIEVHTRLLRYFGRCCEELDDLLAGFNYSNEVLQVRGDELHILARPRSFTG